MESDERALAAIRAMYAEYVVRREAKKREYRNAQLLETCVVWEPPKNEAEALRRYTDRADIDRFLEKCRMGLQ